MLRVPCPKCGYQNPAAASYCTLCQTIFKKETRARPRPAPSERRRDFYSEQSANARRCFLLLAAFVLLVVAVGWGIGSYYGLGPYGLVFGLCGGSIGSLAALYTGDRLVLQVSGAREVSPDEQPVLHNVIEELCIASGLPKPRLHLIESSAPNAFATGRDPAHASVAVTRGLLETMNREELQGVLAHEMSHVRNLDVRYATVVGVLVGTVALLCDGFWRSARFGRRGRWGGRGGAPVVAALALLLALLAPLASRLIQMAVSRRRELLADATAVELTRNPLGLASALRKIASDRAQLEVANRATQHMYIVNPVKSFGMSSPALFSTHPPIEARIRILESMG
jgi:heat shock protein HtpX